MHSPKKDKTIFASVFLIVTIITAAPLANLAHGQRPGQTGSNSSINFDDNATANATSLNIQEIPVEKVRVGDIDVAYKTFGNGDPIILINGLSAAMDIWDPTLLETLASDHTVIIFSNRGIGNTTSGNGQNFSMALFANDTAGLLDALNVSKADVLGYSMGGIVAQELALTHPDKVGKLILFATSCGGVESAPPSQEVQNALANQTATAEERFSQLVPLALPEKWRNENPDYLENLPISSEKVLNESVEKQTEAFNTWPGTCDRLKSITQHTLVIAGTLDVFAPPVNSLIITERIPGAWLVQFKEGGHGLIFQYPEQFSNIVKTFLENTNTP
jgi:pimeloyl-ACP methyl ester carboxylesterase